MKKLFVLFVLMATLLAVLVGCEDDEEGRSIRHRSSSVTETEDTTAPATTGLSCEELLDNFEAKLEPIADQYEVTRLGELELDDGERCQPVVVTDQLLDNTYHIHIYYTAEAGVYRVGLTTELSGLNYLDFALLSYYLYESLNLPGMDAQEFYGHFNMLSEEPLGTMSVEGWDLFASSGSGQLMFNAQTE